MWEEEEITDQKGSHMKKILFILTLSLLARVYADTEARTISVQGAWHTDLTDDRGQITFTVSQTDKDVAKLERETHRTYAQLLRSVEALKLKDQKLESSQYSLYPEYSWDKGKKIYLGHKASIGLSVTTSEINRLGEAIVVANRAGVEEISALRTFLSQKASDEAYRKGLELAMQDAIEKANLLLKAAGAKRGKVVSINESNYNLSPSPMPRPMMAFAKSARMAESAPAPEIQAGESGVNISITAKFAIE